MDSFCPLPHARNREEKLLLLCPVYAMLSIQPPSDAQGSCSYPLGMAWVERPCPRSPLPVGDVTVSFRPIGQQDVILPHSVVVWTALFSVVYVKDICTAAWTPCSFIQFHLLDMSGFCSGPVLFWPTQDRTQMSVDTALETSWALCWTTCPCVPWMALGISLWCVC